MLPGLETRAGRNVNERSPDSKTASIWRASAPPSSDENEWGTGGFLECTREVRRTRMHQRGEMLNLNVPGNMFADVDVDAHEYMLVDQYFSYLQRNSMNPKNRGA
ncbi:hypothetical protein [Paraburkholderia xenovorans]|uniref:hypothetical protein n=1 Tax=Paraburkholderia xenovorans TaxID=36873 RepID=UPI0038B6F05A